MTEFEKDTEQFDEIRADRACIGCGFNLYAQPVIKDPHYGLAICQCPECGTVAALQSYPVMTHWVNRFRSIIAAIWILVLLVFFIGNMMSFMGMATGASSLAGQNMSDIIGQANTAWMEQQSQALAAQSNPAAGAGPTTAPAIPPLNQLPGGTTIVTSNGVTTINGTVVSAPGSAITPGQYRWTWLDPRWIEDHMDAAIDDSGGLVKNIDTEFLVMLIPGTIVAFMFGMFWSVTLLGSSKKRALLVPLVASIGAAAMHIAISIPEFGSTYASNMAQDLYAPVVGPLYITTLFLISAFGILIGRRIARFVVILALPPRNRVPLSLLWTADGKTLPKPK